MLLTWKARLRGLLTHSVVLTAVFISTIARSQRLYYDGLTVNLIYSDSLVENLDSLDKACATFRRAFEACPERKKCIGYIYIYESKCDSAKTNNKYLNLNRAADILLRYTELYGNEEIVMQYIGETVSSKFLFQSNSVLSLVVMIKDY